MSKTHKTLLYIKTLIKIENICKNILTFAQKPMSKTRTYKKHLQKFK
jgi:hypothetical protein